MWRTVIIVLSITFSGAFHELLAESDWLQTIDQRYKSLHGLKAEFSQTTQSSYFPPQESRGIVYFMIPGKMRWDYQSPYQREIASNPEKSWIYDPFDRQAWLSSSNRELQAMSFLWGEGSLKKSFKLERLKKNGDEFQINLLPIKSFPGVEKLAITYNTKQELVTGLTIHDHLGNTNQLTFSQIQINPTLEAKLFTPNFPKGTKLIEN